MTARTAAAATIVYVAGVLWSLLKSDARPAERIALSVCWPLGPLALVITVGMLLAASVIAYPAVMVPTVVVLALLWLTLF